jgi:hypothetical protein
MNRVLLSDASIRLVLRGLWNGFKSIPEAVWRLFPDNVKTLYNLSFIAGMVIFVAVFAVLIRRPRRRAWIRRRVRT